MLLICLASAIWLHLPVKAGQIPPGPRHHEWSIAQFKFGPLRFCLWQSGVLFLDTAHMGLFVFSSKIGVDSDAGGETLQR